jgi:cytochrome c-type biogenesis protein CcmH
VRRALVVAAVAVVCAIAAPQATLAGGPTAADLEAELVCPTCKTTLDQSDAPVARRMKAIIRERLAAGVSAEEIKAELVEQFGPAVLAEPPKRGFDLLAWLLPLVGIGLGVVFVAAIAWAWSRQRRAGPSDGDALLDPELDRRVDDELARYDT